MSSLSFDNTEIAFQHKTDRDLRKARWLFSMFNYKWMIKWGPSLSVLALKLRIPVKGLIRSTIFNQFCGGESIAECKETASNLYQSGVGAILDYSVEGADDEAGYDANYHELKRTIETAIGRDEFPFAVFKMTGIARFNLLEKVHRKDELTASEQSEWERVKNRFIGLCEHAATHGVRLFIDAEDSWIQDPIDLLAMEMMKKFNQKEVLIFNTLQMYRKDRLDFLKSNLEYAAEHQFKLGFKLVRGAYMEKERERAAEFNYPSPIQDTKEDTDRDYDAAVALCFEHRDRVAVCVGSHNEKSNRLLAELIGKSSEEAADERFWFAQLYGMSDNISFNLANAGYNVAKYLPYGPIKAVMPYLGRRAQENSSVSGQVGREMSLILKELNRRSSR
ncbi:MAG: proline dehydrogenase family protein [Flavobacteriales bacterium]|nr:proline dehydrogenase family protein [Bacteroidota bacterium]MCB9241748.1 proline dehydrogenase family protein [Flavobacteriales bacterium]